MLQRVAAYCARGYLSKKEKEQVVVSDAAIHSSAVMEFSFVCHNSVYEAKVYVANSREVA